MFFIWVLPFVYQLLPEIVMAFQKKHKLGFTSDDPLEKIPICIKGRKGQRDRLMAITDWQEKLRDAIDLLLAGK